MRRFLLLATTALVLVNIAPAPAEAGPLAAAIPAAVKAVAAFAATPIGSIIGGAVVSFGANWLFSKLFGPETKQRGVKREVEYGSGLPPSFIFGTYATPGVLVYENVWDGGDIPQQCLVQVIALSFLPVKGVQSGFMCQDERVNINMSSNWQGGFKEVSEYVKGGDDGGYFLVKFYDGTQDSVDPWLLDKFGNHPLYPIHEDCWWRGCALMIIQAWYSNRGIWTGWPEMKWVVEGIPLYDPRRDGSLPGGSGPQRWGQPSTWGQAPANAKVAAYNFIRGIYYKGVWQWGGNAEAYRLPLDYWFPAMNACDEEIALKNGGTVPRGHVGGEIHFDDDPREILAELDKSVCGYTTLQGGFYKTWVGGPGLSVMTITDEDWVITEDREDVLYQGPDQTYNTAYSYYPDPRNKWEMKDGPRYVDDDALAEDGRESALDVQLPFVTHWNHVQRVLRAIVKDSRRQVTHRGILPPEAYVLEPMDRVTVKSVENGYLGNGKAFRLDAKEDLPNVLQDVLLRELNPDDIAWIPAYEMEDSVGPVGNIIAEPPDLGLTLTPSQVLNARGKYRPAIDITWPWARKDMEARRILWKIRRAGTTKKIAQGRITRLQDGDYTLVHPSLSFNETYEIAFLMEYQTPRIVEWGPWGTITMLPAIPPQPAALTATGQIGRIVLRTAKSTNENFSHWNLYGSDTNNFANADAPIEQKGIRFAEDDLPPNKTRYYWLTEVDRWGNEGPKFPASATGGRSATTRQVLRADVKDLAIDTDQLEYHSISANEGFGTALKLLAHYPTFDNPAPAKNWPGNASGNKIAFNVEVCRSGPIKNYNPSRISFSGDMNLIQRCEDSGSWGAGRSEVFTYLVLEYKKQSQGDGMFKPCAQFRGPRCRDQAKESADLKSVKDRRAINYTHRVKDGDTYIYRVMLRGFHRRGSDRGWTKADVSASVRLKLAYTKR